MKLSDNLHFEIFASAAVIASIVVMALETFAFPPHVRELLLALDISLGLFFVAEYLLRIATAQDKRAYITSFYGMIDLLATLPLLLHMASAVRVVRLLRLLRVLRLMKIWRFNTALDRFAKALKLIAPEASLFVGVAFIFIITFAFLIYEIESQHQPDKFQNIFDSIWWVIISLTSVGYGDIYPITSAGRMLALLMVLTGMGIVAVPTALLASALRFSPAEQDAVGD